MVGSCRVKWTDKDIRSTWEYQWVGKTTSQLRTREYCEGKVEWITQASKTCVVQLLRLVSSVPPSLRNLSFVTMKNMKKCLQFEEADVTKILRNSLLRQAAETTLNFDRFRYFFYSANITIHSIQQKRWRKKHLEVSLFLSIFHTLLTEDHNTTVLHTSSISWPVPAMVLEKTLHVNAVNLSNVSCAYAGTRSIVRGKFYFCYVHDWTAWGPKTRKVSCS